MTDYETAELTFSLISYGITTMALYFTVVSSYMIGAYMIGAQLSKSQLIIISSLFSVFSMSLAFGTYSFFDTAISYGGASSGSIEYWLAPVIGLAELIGIIAAFKFMYDIRNKKSTIKAK